MFFPGNFDDDLFTESRDRKKTTLQSYNAKQCEPRWFESLSDATLKDASNIFRFQGNLAYNTGKYAEAVVSYNKSKDALSSNNTTVLREVVEAISRCHIYLNQETQALEAAKQLWEMSSNFEQKTSALNLYVTLYQNFHRYEGTSGSKLTECFEIIFPILHFILMFNSLAIMDMQLNTFFNVNGTDIKKKEMDALEHLIMLINLHPVSPSLWMRLASFYILSTRQPEQSNTDISDLIHLINATQTKPLVSPQLEVCTCLLKARQLLKSVQHNLSSFAKQKNVSDLNKIDVLMEELSISDDDIERCRKKIRQLSYGLDTEDSEERLVPNVQILDVGQKVLREEFESKWFTWNEES